MRPSLGGHIKSCTLPISLYVCPSVFPMLSIYSKLASHRNFKFVGDVTQVTGRANLRCNQKCKNCFHTSLWKAYRFTSEHDQIIHDQFCTYHQIHFTNKFASFWWYFSVCLSHTSLSVLECNRKVIFYGGKWSSGSEVVNDEVIFRSKSQGIRSLETKSQKLFCTYVHENGIHLRKIQTKMIGPFYIDCQTYCNFTSGNAQFLQYLFLKSFFKSLLEAIVYEE